MKSFYNLDEAIDEIHGESTLLANEITSVNGSVMEYLLFPSERRAFEWVEQNRDAKLHAVNFSCKEGAVSKFFIDWESTKELYTETNESKKHAKMIRKLIKTIMCMLEEAEITRYVDWVVENRTRQDPQNKKWKISFHIYADIFFPNNYEILPAFVKAAMDRANLDIRWVDFGPYNRRALFRIIGSSSKNYHILPHTSEEDFYMSLIASHTQLPDVTDEAMKKLKLNWTPKPSTATICQSGDNILQALILEELKRRGETVDILIATGNGGYYGANDNIGRQCLTYPGISHKPRGNRCVIWRSDDSVFYRCLDPEHKSKALKLFSI